LRLILLNITANVKWDTYRLLFQWSVVGAKLHSGLMDELLGRIRNDFIFIGSNEHIRFELLVT